MPDTRTRILIVDDMACIRTSMSIALGEVGYRVRSAENGFSALRAMRQEHPEILLTDLNMPGMSGFELLSVVRRRLPAILVIAMSGSFAGNEVPSGVLADAFYQKGSSMGALLQIIRTLHQREPRFPQPSSSMGPLRIQRNGHDSSGTEYVMITCPECRNTSPQGIDGSDSLIRKMDCIRCGYSIEYAIVDPSDQVRLQTFQRNSTACATQQYNDILPNVL